MVARSLGVSTGFEPSLKTAGQKNVSSGSAHKKGRSAAAIHWSGGFDAASIHHQLTVDFAAIHGQIFRPIQAWTGAELYPLQLPELAVDLPPHSVMPKHGEHVVSFADVESVKVHKKKARD